jgi:hypothetical protein
MPAADRKSMKRIIFSVELLILFFCPKVFLSAQESMDQYEYAEIVHNLGAVGTPVIEDNHIVFTEEHNFRYVGIAFSFENFKKIHPFQIRSLHDKDGNITSSYFFYILPITKNTQSFTYRLVIDGLWTTDPQNQSTEYDTRTGITLSKITLTTSRQPETSGQSSGLTRFVYKGKSGQQIRLGGSFTNWDSWIYEMKETSPGIYELELALAPGTYYYSFYHGITQLLDDTNPKHAYREDGRQISVINVRQQK